MPDKYFIAFISFLVLLRLMELFISSRNAKWLTSNGAVEHGQKHWPFMVSMHSLFIVSIIVEYNLRGGEVNFILFGVFAALIAFKFWVINTLGVYWTTKIYRIPNCPPITGGPYKIIRHPNYAEVCLEIIFTPLVFNLYYTAIIFTLLNAWMLSVRIREENRVWAMVS